MDDKILKIAKRLKTFTLDDIVMFSGFSKGKVCSSLNTLGNIKQCGKHFEYVEKTVAKDKFKIVDKNISCKNSEVTVIAAVEIFLEICKH